MRDVAEMAAVSTATVSHVINGTRPVSPELTERVRAAMAALSYRPDAVARSLRRRETLTLGVLVPSLELPFFASVAYNIERSASDFGYNIILCNSEWDRGEERFHLQDLLARRVDGLICISAEMTADEIAPVVQSGTPVVMFERPMPGINLDGVGIDNERGAYLAVEHLISMGHRRIGFITGMGFSTVSTTRLRGCERALADNELALDPSLIVAGDYTAESGCRAIERLLKLPERPTAVFAFNDLMALGAMQVAEEKGVRIPDDLAVVGFDGIAFSQYANPSLTTVRQPLKEMGRIAVEMLLDRIRGDGPGDAQYTRLEPELVVRESSRTSLQ